MVLSILSLSIPSFNTFLKFKESMEGYSVGEKKDFCFYSKYPSFFLIDLALSVILSFLPSKIKVKDFIDCPQ